jgi:hypothetical protein
LPGLSISADVVRGTDEGKKPRQTSIRTVASGPKEMIQMYTIEEDSGTYTGSLRRHNGYYAGDFTRHPMRTASELSELAMLRPLTFPTDPGIAD